MTLKNPEKIFLNTKYLFLRVKGNGYLPSVLSEVFDLYDLDFCDADYYKVARFLYPGFYSYHF